MLRRAVLVVLVASILLLVPGCGGSSHVGTYTLDKEATKAKVRDATSGENAEQEAVMQAALIDGMTLVLTLEEGGSAQMSFTMSFMGVNETDEREGTWSVSDDTITITAKDPQSGETDSITGKVSGDTLTLTMEGEQTGPAPALVLKKKAG